MVATSRLLEKPQNGAIVSPSAAGKNATVDAGLSLIPPEAVVVIKAGSARALICSDQDYQHPVVLFSEADSIPEDGPAASAIRSLAEVNQMEYDVGERDEITHQFVTRHIVKPGPTVLLTTATRSLGEQLATRMLEFQVSDAPEQPRR